MMPPYTPLVCSNTWVSRGIHYFCPIHRLLAQCGTAVPRQCYKYQQDLKLKYEKKETLVHPTLCPGLESKLIRINSRIKVGGCNGLYITWTCFHDAAIVFLRCWKINVSKIMDLQEQSYRLMCFLMLFGHQFNLHMSLYVRKPTIWSRTRSDTNRPVQLQKMDRSLRFWL